MEQLGNYQLVAPLGQGGMARVYLAYHAQLDRQVAIKILRSDLVEDQGFLARFQREAQAVAALRHPNIVQVYDFDVQDGIYFMVMELLKGDSLKVRLNDYRTRGEQMPWGEVVRIMLDVLAGLAYAHGAGMIHRDIKPSNILLTKEGQAVVADFGIAQIVGGTQYTASGALMGTVNYMAPEQGLEGRSDVCSDLYAAGIVLFEMLAQRPPFEADTPLATLMKHLHDPLPLPRRFNAAAPESFEPILLKALAKQPGDRYQSADEMSGALKGAAEAAGVQIPAYISPPRSFTTADTPSEPVAVFSGAVREHITDAGFSEDDTDSSLLHSSLAVQPKPSQTTGRKRQTLNRIQQVLLSMLGLEALANLIATTYAILVEDGTIFAKSWPMNLFLVAWGSNRLFRAIGAHWLLVPTSMLLGNGLILAYYSLSGNWLPANWMWVLEIWLATGSVVLAVWLKRNQARLSRLQHRLTQVFEWCATFLWITTLLVAAVISRKR